MADVLKIAILRAAVCVAKPVGRFDPQAGGNTARLVKFASFALRSKGALYKKPFDTSGRTGINRTVLGLIAYRVGSVP